MMLCIGVAWAAVTTASPSGEPLRLATWPQYGPGPQFNLVDGDGQRRKASDFRGRVTVIFFGFTHCPDICPAELTRMAQVHRRLGDAASGLQVLFITLDPERDRPALLKSYVTAFNREFIGLTGSTAEVNAAAASFAVQFAKVPLATGYTLDHSTGTYVLDKSGRIHLVGTLQTSIDDWVHDLRELVTGPP